MRKLYFTIRSPSDLFSPCDNRPFALTCFGQGSGFFSFLPTLIYLIISFVLEVALLEYQVDTSF